MKWSDILKNKGRFESQEYLIGNEFNYYFSNLVFISSKSDNTKAALQISICDNYGNWSEWKSYANAKDDIFSNYDDTSNLKLKYKILLESSVENETPSVSNVNLKVNPAFIINNLGDIECKPKIWIRKLTSDGDIKLTNNTNGLQLSFSDLKEGEEIFIDCENEEIITSLPLTYRYDNHNDVFISLGVGKNLLTGEGDFEFDVKMVFKTIQG